MTGVADWLGASRVRRVALIAGFFPLPVVGLISAGIVVMVAALRGPREALLDSGLALALLAVFALVAQLDAVVLVGSAALSCLIWVTLGSLAGWSGSITLAAQAAVMLTLVALVLLLAATGDQVVLWSGLLETVYADLQQQGLELTVDIGRQAVLMSSVIAAALLAGSLLSLLIGVVWARGDRTDRPGWQFSELRMGYVIGGLAALAGVAALFGLPLYGVLLVFGVAFVFHGVSVLVWWSRRLSWPRAWWLVLCVLPLLLPNLLVLELALLAALGFVDNWYGLRRSDS